jgi:spore coat protein H
LANGACPVRERQLIEMVGRSVRSVRRQGLHGSLGLALSAAAGLHCAGEDVTSITLLPGSPSTPIVSNPARPLLPEPIDGDGDGPEEPAPGFADCAPRALGGPFWLAEGETVGIEFECATGAILPGEALALRDLPTNATYDAQKRRLTFTPGLDQAGVYDLVVGVLGTDDVGHVEVQVADAFAVAGNAPVDPETYTLEYGLPVVHLGVSPDIDAVEYRPASIVYRGHTFEGAEAKYRGRTSLAYPKKSYTLKFTKTDRFGDPISVAGFERKRKVTLTTTFDDNSYLRGRLAFELWNRLSAEHIQVETYSAVVYLNGEYHGLYTVTDHVDRHLMEDNGLFEDGNLYKARSHRADFRLSIAGVPKALIAEGYEKQEGIPAHGEPGAYADLEALVSWVATASREAFLAELPVRLAQRDYEDWWLLVSVLDARDSAGKNSYHYHDARPGSPDGRFHYIPWDFNDSSGQNWRTIRRAATATHPLYFAERNHIFERLLGEPVTRDPLLERFRRVLEGEWNAPGIVERIDAWAQQIHASALRDEGRWAAAYADHFFTRKDLTKYEEEVAYMRQWVFDRHAYLRDLLASGPLVLEPPAEASSGTADPISSEGDHGTPDSDDDTVDTSGTAEPSDEPEPSGTTAPSDEADPNDEPGPSSTADPSDEVDPNDEPE